MSAYKAFSLELGVLGEDAFEFFCDPVGLARGAPRFLPALGDEGTGMMIVVEVHTPKGWSASRVMIANVVAEAAMLEAIATRK